MRYLLLLLIAACAYTVQPGDIVRPAPVMCQPLNQDLWDCRDGFGHLWRCDAIGGRWSCYRLFVVDEIR